MIEYEQKFTIASSVNALTDLGDVSRTACLTDFYLVPDEASAPKLRLRRTQSCGEVWWEATIKTPTGDRNARNEWTYKIPEGKLKVSPSVPQASKTRITLSSLWALGTPLPASVICTVDIFFWPQGVPPIMELEGPKGLVVALTAQLATATWLTKVDNPKTVCAPREE